VIGTEMRRMIDEPDARQELHDAYADLFKAMFCTSSPIPIKAALNMLGIEVGGLRLPMIEASEEEKGEVRAALERHGLLSAV
jgi:4-hydroxy-tetrahydrodipicolinate synthase